MEFGKWFRWGKSGSAADYAMIEDTHFVIWDSDRILKNELLLAFCRLCLTEKAKYFKLYVCLFMIDPVGPMIQQTFTIRLHVYACYTKSSVFSKTQSTQSTQSRAWRIVDQCLPASQITCRLGVPSTPVSGQHQQAYSAYSSYRRTHNERHSAARVQIKRWIDKTRWLGPGHITSWVRMSAPEYHTSTLTHARVALRNTAATVPSRGYVCHRCRAYVPLVACRSGEHLRPDCRCREC